MYRFDETAILHKAIVSNDSEEQRSAVKGIEFRCFVQTGKTKGKATIIEGGSSGTTMISLQTDDERVAVAEADDYVEYDGHKYIVESVGYVKSLAFKGAKEYVLGLK